MIQIAGRRLWTGACNPTIFLSRGVFIDRFIFKSNLLWMRLPWECHNQSQDTYWRVYRMLIDEYNECFWIQRNHWIAQFYLVISPSHYGVTWEACACLSGHFAVLAIRSVNTFVYCTKQNLVFLLQQRSLPEPVHILTAHPRNELVGLAARE